MENAILRCLTVMLATLFLGTGYAEQSQHVFDMDDCNDTGAASVVLYASANLADGLFSVEFIGNQASPDDWDPGGSSCGMSWQESRTVNRKQYLDSGWTEWLCNIFVAPSAGGSAGYWVTKTVTAGWGAVASAVAAAAGAASCSFVLGERDFIMIDVEQVRHCSREWDGQLIQCNTHCSSWRDF